jgi:hypothetical protein
MGHLIGLQLVLPATRHRHGPDGLGQVERPQDDAGRGQGERLPQSRDHQAPAPAIGAQIVAIDDDAGDAVGCVAATHMVARTIDGTPKP